MRDKFVSLFILVALSACTSDPETLFSKLPVSYTGVGFNNRNIETEAGNILLYEYYYNGGGVAVGDINNDGLPDLYFTSNNEENKLYLNKGDLQFEDITAASGTACIKGWKTGVCMVDANGDGWLDIYVSRSALRDTSLRKNILLINRKNLTFSDEAEAYGLADDSYSTQAAFFDYDRDGDLDAFLLNHSLLSISNSFDISQRSGTRRFPHVGNKLMRNDNGVFIDVSDSLGIFGPSSNYGLGVSLSDLNDDGWVDIFTGSDYTGRDRLLLNQAGGYFSDVTDSALSHISKFTMGTDIADFNGDGLMDIYSLDMLPEDNKRQKLLLGADRYNVFNKMVESGLHHQYMRNMLQLNTGAGYFSEIGQLAGVSNTDWSWAPLLADFDNDGIQDLFVSNGFKRDLTNSDFAKYHANLEIEKGRRAGRPVSQLVLIEKFEENKIHNYLFKGMGNLTFKDQVSAWGFDEPNLTNGAAYADLDNDGDLDLVTNNINSSAGIYRNNSQSISANHFLKLSLEGKGKNKGAVGAKATVWVNGKPIVRELFPVRGFQSSVDPTLHFGLGKINAIDSIVVRWPQGGEETITDVTVDKVLKIVESPRQVFRRPMPSATYFTSLGDLIHFNHHENSFVDFDVQSLLPRMYSTQGPALAKGDINHDGLEDLFVGGAKGQASGIFLQDKSGKFVRTVQPHLEQDLDYESVDAVFFDADLDGDQDLYVVSGGYEFMMDDKLLQDRLYKNDGKGKFTKSNLPEMRTSKSCVRPSDLDQDGDTDLFVGGRLIPGRYPETPRSYILVNDGKGSFSIREDLQELNGIGMVTDAVWTDLNNDKKDDLLVVGEWMGIEIFILEKDKPVRRTSQYVKPGTEGWWNCITAADFDGDGDNDFVVGNSGTNNQIKATTERPATMVYGDFDHNGSVDPVLTHYVGEKSFPYASRDELFDQLPGLKKRFPTYASYTDATLEQVIAPDELKNAKTLKMFQMRSCYLRNEGNGLVLQPLPSEMQIAPVFAVTTMDVNRDGKLDFIAGGNLSGTRSRSGKMTGNSGFVFLGDGKGNFEFLSPSKTGLRCVGDVRRMIRYGDNLVIGLNDADVMAYKLK